MLVVVAGDGLSRLRRGPHVARHRRPTRSRTDLGARGQDHHPSPHLRHADSSPFDLPCWTFPINAGPNIDRARQRDRRYEAIAGMVSSNRAASPPARKIRRSRAPRSRGHDARYARGSGVLVERSGLLRRPGPTASALSDLINLADHVGPSATGHPGRLWALPLGDASAGGPTAACLAPDRMADSMACSAP
jgi:hypothetical protein